MSAFQQFTIRCSRDIHNIQEDDIITINPRWNEIDEEIKMLEYVVCHHIAPCSSNDGTPTKTKQILFGSNIQNYIGNLIDLLSVDIQPFKQIQFDFPCMPSIIVTPSQLPSIRHVIMSTMYGLHEVWPTGVNKKTKSRPLNVHAEPFIPESLRTAQGHDTEVYRTPQRPITRSVAPPRIERPVARHIFFDEEDGHVTRYFN
jgi:hypothetical protein